MRPLKINFVPRRSVPLWVWAVAAALLLCVAGLEAWRGWALQAEAAALTARVAQLQGARDEMDRAAAELRAKQEVEPAYLKDATQALQVAAFPVERVLAAIESARVAGVKLVSLELSGVQALAKAELEFADQGALIDYMEALNAGEAGVRWNLTQVRPGTNGAANTASVSASWHAESMGH